MLRNDLQTEIELWMGEKPLLVEPEAVAEMVEVARREFLADFATNGGAFLNEREEREIQDWVVSEEARKIEEEIAADLDWLFQIMKKDGLGAHDLRHMLLVSWTGLLTIEEMNWTENWRKWALVGCLSHDWGRVIEGKMRQAIVENGGGDFFWQDGIHATLSFFVLEKFLMNYQERMPRRLIDLILYSALEHPGRVGAYDTAGVLAAIVQNSDRTQMMNAEGPARMMGEEVSQFGYYLGMEREEKAKFHYVIADEGFRQSLKQRMEFFWRRIHLLVGREVTGAEEKWKKRGGRVLWTMCLDWQREQVFAPEILVYEKGKMNLEEYKNREEKENWKEIIGREVWEEMRMEVPEEKWAKVVEWGRKNEIDLLREVMTAKGMGSTEEEIEKVAEAWRNMNDEEERWRFKLMLGWLLEYRGEEEIERAEKEEELARKYNGQGIIEEILRLVQKYL